MRNDLGLNYTEQRAIRFGEVCKDVLDRQRPDGSWDWRAVCLVLPTLALRARLDRDDLLAMNTDQASPEVYLRACATAIVVYWLESRGREAKRDWAPAATRAKRWLSRRAPRPLFGESWMACKTNYLRALGA